MTAPTPTVFLAETSERFLKAIVARLPLERIIELHLFPSIKQGGMESGVAVIAAVPEGEVAIATSAAQSADTASEVESVEPAPTATQADAEEALDAMDAADATAEPGAELATPDSADPDAEPPLPEVPLEALVSSDEACLPPIADQVAAEGVDALHVPHPTPDAPDVAEMDTADAERLEEAVHAIVDEVEDPAAQAMAAASLELADLPPTDERPRRYTIYTARYRLILKGPDRGKWEVSVNAEADAPLVTVEMVVRGVQRRAGESDEVGRWTGEELRTALRLA